MCIRDSTRFSLSAHMLVALAFSGGYLTAFLWGAVHLSAGCITFGTMTAFLQLVGKVQRPVFDLSRLIPSVVNALTAIDRLLELERLPAEADGDSIFLASTPELELKDVTLSLIHISPSSTSQTENSFLLLTMQSICPNPAQRPSVAARFMVPQEVYASNEAL